SHRGGKSAFEADTAGLSTRAEAAGQVDVRLASPVGDQTLQLAYMPGVEVTGGTARVEGGTVQHTGTQCTFRLGQGDHRESVTISGLGPQFLGQRIQG